MMISENQVSEILHQVIHPASGKSIVETGIVKHLIVNDNKIVIVPKGWSKYTYTNTDDLVPELWIKI